MHFTAISLNWTDADEDPIRYVMGAYSTAMDRIHQALSYVRYALPAPSNRIFGYLSNLSLRPNQNQNRARSHAANQDEDAGTIRGLMDSGEVWT